MAPIERSPTRAGSGQSESTTDPPPDPTKELKGKRKSFKGAITRIQNFVRDYNIAQGSKFDVEVRIEQLRSTYDKYLDVQTQLEAHDYDAHQADSVEMDKKFCETHSKLRALYDSLCNKSFTSSQPTNSNSKSISMPVKLPNINITTFSGKSEQWKTFHSLFSATIHNNVQLDTVQKFYYLKSFLADEPLNLINDLELTSENYSKALSILTDRYDNKLLNVNHHLKTLLEMPSMLKGNAHSLREFVTNVNQHINALKSLALPVESWDVIIVYLLSKKVDINTHRSFELERNSDELPSLAEFIKHVEKRALAFENIDSNNSKSYTSKVSHFNANVNSNNSNHSNHS